MTHVLFLVFVALYVLTLGQNWGVYSAALMIAAYARHDGRLAGPVAAVG